MKYKINDWDINHFRTLSQFNGDSSKQLIHNRMGRVYWVWKDDKFYEQRFSGGCGPYQVRNIVFLRNIYPNAKCALDIGMNVGNNTMEYATWVDEVHGFEPFPSTYALAETNVRLNEQLDLHGRYWDNKSASTLHDPSQEQGWYKVTGGFASLNMTGKVILHNVGIGDKPGSFEMAEHVNNAGQNHIMPEGKDKGTYKLVPVQVNTIDSFNYPHVDFMKIDVEGFEREVIHGAEQTIDRCRPTVQLEIIEGQCKRFGTTPQELCDFFLNKDYKMFSVRGEDIGTTWYKMKGLMDNFFVPKELSHLVK